ncbi:endopolygalacturonase 2 precursor [Desarmillaria ectypa]|nr:endopolygalacturonase 2 precursor [Desarmillaria ectypa]
MFKHILYQTVFAAVVLALVSAVPMEGLEACEICTVDSVSAASSISSCSAVTIKAFTVPSGSMLYKHLDALPQVWATVTMAGDITFAKTTSPLFTIDGDNITFKGAGYKSNVIQATLSSLHLCSVPQRNSASYWDGKGTNGVDKPHPFLKFKASGIYSFTVLNNPAQAISIGNSDGLTFDSIIVDSSAGDTNSLGHNTDGFDVSADDVTIQNSVVKNQDDCIAINSGSNIVALEAMAFLLVTNSMYGLRIKVKAAATNAKVSGITYSGNNISGITKYGVLISQSYPDDAGTPGTGGPISGVSFAGSANIVKTRNFSKLTLTGRPAGAVSSDDVTISGGLIRIHSFKLRQVEHKEILISSYFIAWYILIMGMLPFPILLNQVNMLLDIGSLLRLLLKVWLLSPGNRPYG